MPIAPKNPCSRCRRLVCNCSRQRRRPELGTRQQRGYTDEWLRKVAAAIEEQPWCSYCGEGPTPSNPLEGDHAVPMSKGGSPDQEPVVACRRCNRRKGGRAGVKARN